jgi:hypothetical protein
MTRNRKLDENLWDEADESLSSDHVIERFFSQRERAPSGAPRKPRSGPKTRRRPDDAVPERDDSSSD